VDIRHGALIGLGWVGLIVDLRLLLGQIIVDIVVGNGLAVNL